MTGSTAPSSRIERRGYQDRWRIRLDFRDVWALAAESEIPMAELARTIADVLPLANAPVDLVDRFRIYADCDVDDDRDEFDGHLVALYDWADSRRVWIATSSWM